jgi:hypothetical protein
MIRWIPPRFDPWSCAEIPFSRKKTSDRSRPGVYLKKKRSSSTMAASSSTTANLASSATSNPTSSPNSSPRHHHPKASSSSSSTLSSVFKGGSVQSVGDRIPAIAPAFRTSAGKTRSIIFFGSAILHVVQNGTAGGKLHFETQKYMWNSSSVVGRPSCNCN